MVFHYFTTHTTASAVLPWFLSLSFYRCVCSFSLMHPFHSCLFVFFNLTFACHHWSIYEHSFQTTLPVACFALASSSVQAPWLVPTSLLYNFQVTLLVAASLLLFLLFKCWSALACFFCYFVQLPNTTTIPQSCFCGFLGPFPSSFGFSSLSFHSSSCVCNTERNRWEEKPCQLLTPMLSRDRPRSLKAKYHVVYKPVLQQNTNQVKMVTDVNR